MTTEIQSNETPNVQIQDNHGGQQFTPAGNPQVQASVGVLSTAKDKTGGTLHGPITPESRVTIRGGEMTVAQAERLGFVAKDANGNYRDVAPGQSHYEQAEARRQVERHEARQAAATRDTDLKFAGETVEAVTNWTSALRRMGGNPAAAISEMMVNPTKVPSSLRLLAESHGHDPDAMLPEIQQISQDVETALGHYLQDQGVQNVNDWSQYVEREYGRGGVINAISAALVSGNAAQLRQMVNKYQRFGK